MNRSIKVSDGVYRDLLKLQRPRETFSEVVGRLLNVYDLMGKARPLFRTEADELGNEYLKAHDGARLAGD